MKQYIVQNNDKIIENLNKMFNYSTLVYTGQINGDKSTKNYYKNGQIIMVTDTGDSTMITLYQIDFGFGSKTDVILTDSIMGEMNELKEKMANKEYEIQNSIEQKQTEIINMSAEIDCLKQKLQLLTNKKDSLENEVKFIKGDVEVIRKEYESFALKICNSAEYRKDLAKLNAK